MKIHEFSIIIYGPLKDFKEKLTQFNLFYGENEQGKTLTIDALIKFLLGNETKDYRLINRVSDDPHGYVIIENDAGELITITQLEKTKFQKISGLSAQECKNLFIIRSSDLSIKSDEAFYSQITEKLTGIQTRPISEIKVKLRRIGKLTDKTFIFSNAKDDGKFKTHYDNAETTVKNIQKFRKKCIENNQSNLDSHLIRKKEELLLVNSQIELYYYAHNRENFEKGMKYFDKLIGLQEQLIVLNDINQEDKETWSKSIIILEDKRALKIKTEENLQEQKQKLTENEGQYTSLKKESKDIIDFQKPVIDKIQVLLDRFKENKIKIKTNENLIPIFKKILPIMLVFLLISLIGVFLQPSNFILITSILLFLIIISLFYILWGNKRNSKNIELIEEIKNNFARINIKIEDVTEVFSIIEEFKNKIKEIENQTNKLEWEKDNQLNVINEINNKEIPEINEEIENLGRIIEEIKGKSEISTLDMYIEKFEEKLNLESKLRDKIGNLDGLFDTNEEMDIEERREVWTEKLKNLEQYRDKALSIKYDSQIEENLRKNSSILKDECEFLEEGLKKFRSTLEEFQSSTQTILVNESEDIEQYKCEDFSHLNTLEEGLTKFIKKYDEQRDFIKKAIEIFDIIEIEEKQKVSEMFDDPKLKEIFNNITNGRYIDVSYDPKESLQVTLSNNQKLKPDDISSGAYDQLYFSIRLALGKKVLKDRYGFFILDDPFIKSDIKRLHRKLQLLYDLSEEGWQILYFTAKKEVMNFFNQEKFRDKITKIPVIDKLS